MTSEAIFRRLASAIVGCGLCASVTSCSHEEADSSLIPVSGTVTLDGELLTTGGSVSYRDASGLVQPTGVIAPDGTYNLFLNRKQGAPAGHYRVVVFASEPIETARIHDRLPKLLVNKKFMDVNTTPFRVEVKPTAHTGDYDLAVTK